MNMCCLTILPAIELLPQNLLTFSMRFSVQVRTSGAPFNQQGTVKSWKIPSAETTMIFNWKKKHRQLDQSCHDGRCVFLAKAL